MIKLTFIVGAGGFIGTVARFFISRFFQGHILSAFPYGTFFINVTGCLLIGIFYGLIEKGNIINSEWRLFLTVGICGGYTTFSTFANENMLLLRDKEFFFFALYAGASVILGLSATYLGNVITKII